jgi:hypothetical protein
MLILRRTPTKYRPPNTLPKTSSKQCSRTIRSCSRRGSSSSARACSSSGGEASTKASTSTRARRPSGVCFNLLCSVCVLRRFLLPLFNTHAMAQGVGRHPKSHSVRKRYPIIITCRSPFFLNRTLAEFPLKSHWEGRNYARQAALGTAVTFLQVFTIIPTM